MSADSHGWDSSRCFLLSLAGLEEQDSAPAMAQYLPPSQTAPIRCVGCTCVCSEPAQLCPSPSTWWDHHQGDTSHRWDILLLRSTRPHRPRHQASCHPDPEHQGLKKRAFYQKKYTEEAQSRALESFPGASVGLATDDFGKASPSPALPVWPSHITCGADLGFIRFIPRKDSHAIGKQCSSTVSH